MPSSSLRLPLGVEPVYRTQRFEQRRAFIATFAPVHGEPDVVEIDRQILVGYTAVIGYLVRLDDQLPAVFIIVTAAGLARLRRRLDADHVELALGQQRGLGEVARPPRIADRGRQDLQQYAEQHREDRECRHDLDQGETGLRVPVRATRSTRPQAARAGPKGLCP